MTVELKTFTKTDYMVYGGVEADNPMIGYIGDDFAVILDGTVVTVFSWDLTEYRYECQTPDEAYILASTLPKDIDDDALLAMGFTTKEDWE